MFWRISGAFAASMWKLMVIVEWMVTPSFDAALESTCSFWMRVSKMMTSSRNGTLVWMLGVDGTEVLHDADLADTDLRERPEDGQDQYKNRGDADDPEADRRPRRPWLRPPDGHAFPPRVDSCWAQ